MAVLPPGISDAAEDFDADRVPMLGAISGMIVAIDQAQAGGDEQSLARHLSRGKLAPRDRVARLLDPGSPIPEIGPVAAHGMYFDEFPSSGKITGVGCPRSHNSMFVCNEAAAEGGTCYPMMVKNYLRVQGIALENRLPCVYLIDSGGANLLGKDEVIADREHFGRILLNRTGMSAAGIPQIASTSTRKR